ncbi:hypothetical protein FRB95_004053 [Tulasnella sp. JGI-2019a]|nr:hypothetical protein FRB95_004053 [Tulasnella sp. JGI-2019a]
MLLCAQRWSLGTYRVEYDHIEIDMENELGRGGFGTVRRGRFREQLVAVKCLRSDESKDIRVAYRLVREMKIWSGIRHKNILPLIGFYLSRKLDIALIVCPIAPYGSLRDYVLHEKPNDGRRLRLPPHSEHVMQANALVNPQLRAVLSDFGLAVAASEAPSGLTTSRGLIGSFRWWSPELFDDTPRSTTSDVWSWANLLVEVMKERVPYSWIKDDIAVVKAIITGTLPEPIDSLSSPLNLWAVIGVCWEVDQAKRATGSDALMRLEALINAVEDTNSSHVAHELYTRFELERNRADLDAAIEYQQESLQFYTRGHSHRLAAVRDAALYVYARFKEDEKCTDLDAAIAYQ